jgi:protease PrsW
MSAHALNNLLPMVVTLAEVAAGGSPPTESTAPPEVGLLEAWLWASLMNLIVFLPFVVLILFLLWRSAEGDTGGTGE